MGDSCVSEECCVVVLMVIMPSTHQLLDPIMIENPLSTMLEVFSV